MQFKTFFSYDTTDLDLQMNQWALEAFEKRLQVLDVKVNTAFSPDGKALFSANLIFQKAPEAKTILNPCCKREDLEPVVQKEGEDPQEGMIPCAESVAQQERAEVGERSEESTIVVCE